MSYHMYTTEGIILKRTAFGEANAIFHILTSDLGLIIASAQAVRLSASKLRSSLQEYSYITLATVKGKGGWKVTNAIAKENFYFEYPPFAQKFVSQIAGVLVRMMPGEERHPEVFNIVLNGFLNLKNREANPQIISGDARSAEGRFREKNISNFECLMILRILYHLGYVSSDTQTEKFLSSTDEWSESILDDMNPIKKVLIEKINNGLKESQL